jgi:hypothetical protein
MYIHFEPQSSGQALHAVELLLFVSMAVNAGQQLGHASAYGYRGLFAWRLQRYVYTLNGLKGPQWGLFLGRGGIVFLAFARLMLMTTLILLPGFDRGPLPPLQGSLLTGLYLLNLLVKWRSFLTATAAEQLGSMILLCLVACAWWPDLRFHALTLCAIAGYSLICYVTNGLIKLQEPAWRSGAALHRLIQLDTYSIPAVKAWAAGTDQRVIGWLSMGVICWELSAVAAPFLPREGLYLFMAGGILFHLTVAMAMGLNTFFFTFLSTYPAILFLHRLIDGWLA